MFKNHSIRMGLITAMALLLSACSGMIKPPQPWERDVLAQPKMQIGGDPVDLVIDGKIYFSKQSSAIGRSIGGGGCGCN